MQGGTSPTDASQPIAAPPAARRAPFLQAWMPLVVLQALVGGLVLFPFLTGSDYFAFLDIGSDTYVNAATHMHLARLISREGFSGWSFGFGLGAPVAFAYNDIIGHLTQVAGAGHVFDLRIWVYVLKLLAGGAFFLALARSFVQRGETALLAALAYTFCGYIVSNGQWDSETDVFVFAPWVLLGMRRCVQGADWVTFPLAVGAMLLSGVFFVFVGVSLFYAMALFVAAAEDRRAALRTCVRRFVPLAALGFVLGAAYSLPNAVQLLDSPRVAGAGSLLLKVTQGELSVSNLPLLLEELGGLFHKDIFGIGGMHHAFMNYLESPGFYVGMLPLLLLPQLAAGTRMDRRLLVVGLSAVALYMVFPVFRLAAFGFAVPYFRGTTLWVALVLLLLGTRALDRVLAEGVNLRLLAAGAATLLGILALVAWQRPVSSNHVLKIAVTTIVWAALFALFQLRRVPAARIAPVVLSLLLVELVTMAWPSFFVLRVHAAPENQPMNDVTQPALAAIRADRPPPFYRVEKTYESFGHSDALAQDYMGVRSYYYHGRSIVQFHEGMDLMHDFPNRPVNYTNWLPAPGDRFVLHSVLGVRYVISKTKLDWLAFDLLASGPGYFVYRNELALPLGVVHTRQVAATDLAPLSALPLDKARWMKDIVLANAVVLDEPMPQWGSRFDVAGLVAKGEIDAPRDYAEPALALQRTGLQVTQFANDHIVGTIRPDKPGILVFSIPAYRGWSLSVDGQPVALMKADFGMLAAPVAAGEHRIELTYRLPGLRAGLAASAAALAVLLALWIRSRRRVAAGAGDDHS